MLAAALSLVSAIAFLYYGGQTLFAAPPRVEYERYGMSRLRVLVGVLQVLGAVGVLVGLAWTPIGVAAAAGLTLMMLLGLFVRYRLHDSPRLMVPAGTLALLNGGLVIALLTR